MIAFIERYKTILGALSWFFFMIVVPTIIWFSGVDHRFTELNSKLVVQEKRSEQLEIRVRDIEVRIADKLEIIHKDIGEIKGELKRLQ